MDDQNQVLRVAQDDIRICHPEGLFHRPKDLVGS
jgi:hypothetical protein